MALYKTTVVGCNQITENTLEIVLKRPSNFSFKAGQYIQLSVPKLLYSDYKGASRVFSVASSPVDQEKISVAFRDTGSGFKRTLKELSINAPVNIEGPHGFFTLPQKPTHPIVFIAGGIGVTPYLSMIRFATEHDFNFPVTLLYANRNKESAAYLEELRAIAVHNKYFTLKNKFGRIDEQFIRQNVKNIRQCAWSIAGPLIMVDSMRNILLLLGVSGDRIYAEAFTGYE